MEKDYIYVEGVGAATLLPDQAGPPAPGAAPASAPAKAGMPKWAIPAALAAVAGLWWMKSKK